MSKTIVFKNYLNQSISRNIESCLNLFSNIQSIPQINSLSHLIALPALIDPHVHFRTPGLEHKEDWQTGARAAFAGGYTTVCDMPNTLPPTTTCLELMKKHERIRDQLTQVKLPLHYGLYFGANRETLFHISKAKQNVIGLKIFMGSSTGGLVMSERADLERAFQIAAQENVLVAVHAEDEACLQAHRAAYANTTLYSDHSKMRAPACAKRAIETAIELCAKYATRLYILHVSTQAELNCIRQAKKNNLPIFAEVTPHHLFLNHLHYEKLQGKALVNPPLRTQEDNAALWDAILDGSIDTIGTDHAPHTLFEKSKPMGVCPCGMPSIENTLSLLLNANHQGKLSLKDIVRLTHSAPKQLFSLPDNEDWVLVDLNAQVTIQNKHLLTKCAWSPYEGFQLQGAPQYIVSGNQLYDLNSHLTLHRDS